MMSVSPTIQVIIYVSIFFAILVGVFLYRRKRLQTRKEQPEIASGSVQQPQVPQIVVTGGSPYSMGTVAHTPVKN